MTDGETADPAHVEELTATVDGLTDELIDLQERVRELEAQLGGEANSEGTRASESVEELFAKGNGESASEASDLEDVETIGDDILVG